VKLLFYLTRLMIEIPGEPPKYAKPPNTTEPKYIEFLEDNAHIIYPALAIAVLVLIALGILQAWRTDDISGLQKAEIKRDIVRELRREMHGITVEHMAKLVAVPPFRLLKILEEMQTDGIAESRTDTQRTTTWRLKGLRG
jgi:hypothetical protein